jgi:hypothetical protein
MTQQSAQAALLQLARLQHLKFSLNARLFSPQLDTD